MTNAAITTAPAYITSAIATGYVYECTCGELYNSVAAAFSCRKCRNYCAFGYCVYVVDIRDSNVVAGTVPTAEEVAEAQELAEARWAEEKAALDLYIAMANEEGELYEQEMARLAEQAAVDAVELAEDIAYGIQDELMGY